VEALGLLARRTLNFAVDLCGNDWIGPVEPGIVADRAALVASVGEQRLWTRLVEPHQFFIGRRVRGFASLQELFLNHVIAFMRIPLSALIENREEHHA
jgi:hypothetical protein